MILLASQKDLDKEEPTAEDLYAVGTAAVIMRMLKLPDGRIRILVQGLARAQIESVDATGEYLRSRVSVMQEVLPPERSLGSGSLGAQRARLDGEGHQSRKEHFSRSNGDHCKPRRRRTTRGLVGLKSRAES